MPPGSMAYTLVGFCPQLDWRPLRFVKPLPLNRVCEACGLVRKWTALLPCRHSLCESCYELSTRDSGGVCPLDGHQFEEEDVDLKEFTAEELLRRQVKCWNEGYDCRAVLPASEIAQHFHRDCRHHCVSCPRCSATVPCVDVYSHLQSECCATAAPAPSGCEGISSRKDETELLSSFRRILEEQGREMKIVLERLDEVLHGVNSCQEALREELRQGISGLKDTVRQQVAQVKTEHRHCAKISSDEIAAFSEETKARFIASSDSIKTISDSMGALEQLLRDELAKVAREKRNNGPHVVGGSELATQQVEESSEAASCTEEVVPRARDLLTSEFEFVVKGVKSLQEQARPWLHAQVQSERAHLRGYCMSACIDIVPSGGILLLRAFILLHKGAMDDDVQWPCKATPKLRLLHPKGSADREFVADAAYRHLHRGRPILEMLHSFWVSEYIHLEDLFRDGYLEDDQLRVKFELLP